MIIHIERAANEKEHERSRDIHVNAEPEGLRGLPDGRRRVISLHIILVNAKIGYVDEQPVKEHNPKCICGEIRSKAPKAELSLCGDVMINGGKSTADPCYYNPQHQQCTDCFNDALHYFSPDNGFHSAQNSVPRNHQSGDKNYGIDVKARKRV